MERSHVSKPVSRGPMVNKCVQRQAGGMTLALTLACVAAVGLAGGFLIGRHTGFPFVYRDDEVTWSIGVFAGASPLSVVPGKVRNPVLTARDVADLHADLVSDPFMVHVSGKWHMFFEVLSRKEYRKDIALATSDDGLSWTYRQIVLHEPFDLSYPYVFQSGDDFYMLPETKHANSIRLYRASDFPTQWLCIGTLLYGQYVDPSIVRYGDRWWLFTAAHGGGALSTLLLYYADDLLGPWTEHPRSPIVANDKSKARPAGRILVLGTDLLRFAQSYLPHHGSEVRAFRITKLTTTDYAEEEANESPVLKGSGEGWNGYGMHTIDAHQVEDGSWMACVDGSRKRRVLRFHR